MRIFSKTISFLLNPIFIPLLGILIFYTITPKYFHEKTIQWIVLVTVTYTSIIPLIFYFILKHFKKVTNFDIPKVQERKAPLYLSILLLLIATQKIVEITHTEELMFFLIGILTTLIVCLTAVLLNFKASMHMMGVSALTGFIINLSLYYETNLINLIIILCIVTGLVASARLYLKCHTLSEIIVGFAAGIIPQFLFFWLL